MLGLGKIRRNLQALRKFLFHREPTEFNPLHRPFFIAGRFAWMVLEEFWRNRGTQKSAALAYTSLLSLFPLLAVVSIFAAHFYEGGPDQAEDLVVRVLARYVLPTEPAFDETEQTVVIEPATSSPEHHGLLEDNIRESYQRFRDNAGKIAGVGSVGLLLAAMALFTACETFFNQIWKVQTRRSMIKRFSAFSTVLVSLPAIITLGTLISRFLQDQLDLFTGSAVVGNFSLWTTSLAAMLAPFLFVWIGLSIAFMLIPNTRVAWFSALIGGFVSAFLWIVAKEFFFSFIGIGQIRRSIMEAFGATLIFLIWLYFLWFIVLVGVEISYLVQNSDIVMREHFKNSKDLLRDPRLYILVLGRIGESFYRNEGGLRFNELRQRTNLRESELEQIIVDLADKNFVATREDDRLILQRPPENINLGEVFEIACCPSTWAGPQSGEDHVYKTLQRMDKSLPREFGKMTLRNLLQVDETQK